MVELSSLRLNDATRRQLQFLRTHKDFQRKAHVFHHQLSNIAQLVVYDISVPVFCLGYGHVIFHISYSPGSPVV